MYLYWAIFLVRVTGLEPALSYFTIFYHIEQIAVLCGLLRFLFNALQPDFTYFCKINGQTTAKAHYVGQECKDKIHDEQRNILPVH